MSYKTDISRDELISGLAECFGDRAEKVLSVAQDMHSDLQKNHPNIIEVDVRIFDVDGVAFFDVELYFYMGGGARLIVDETFGVSGMTRAYEALIERDLAK